MASRALHLHDHAEASVADREQDPECVNALVDLQARTTAANPAELLERIDAMLAEQIQLPWAPSISGTMRV
jgi:hypothetical protein